MTKVEKRNDVFASRLSTNITHEKSSSNNPYLVDSMGMFGYEHLELMSKRDFSDVIFLLFRGELPKPEEKILFDQLCIAFINPGPRHPATQAAITSAVSKAKKDHILPIALNIFAGDAGSASICKIMMDYQSLLSAKKSETREVLGFGQLYGDVDCYAEKLLLFFVKNSHGQYINWAKDTHDILKKSNVGILNAGLFAAVLLDLGFEPKLGNGLMQLIVAPGLLAHGMEYSDKSLTSMFFEDDKDYEIHYPDKTQNR